MQFEDWGDIRVLLNKAHDLNYKQQMVTRTYIKLKVYNIHKSFLNSIFNCIMLASDQCINLKDKLGDEIIEEYLWKL